MSEETIKQEKQPVKQEKIEEESYDPDAWREIQIPNTVTLKRLHESDLTYIADISAVQEGDGEWCCNGVEIFKDGCKSGLTDMGLHEGIKCWRSTDAEADFDLCENCIRWVIHNEKIQGDLGIGDL